MPPRFYVFAAARTVGLTLTRSLVWSVTFLSLGYYGGDRWRELLDAARAHVIPVAVVALAVLVISTARRWRNLG